MEIKVSVIIPVYNVEKYIYECIMSVCRQTLKEIEIICVNDGSPDKSMDIISQIAEKDNRIVIVNKENGGLSSARNAGFMVAKGEYVYFLDSDDYILNDTLETLYQIASENQLDDILFDAEAFFETEEDAKKNKNYLTYYKRNNSYDTIKNGQELFVELHENNDIRPSACLQMVRRGLLIENNISFYEGILHEDNLFSLQIYITAKRIMHVARKFYMRRVHGNSIMTCKKGARSSIGYYVGEVKCIEFLKEHSVSSEFKKALVEYLLAMERNAMHFGKEATNEEITSELEKMDPDIQVGYRCFILRYINSEKRILQVATVKDEIKQNQKATVDEKKSKKVLVKLKMFYSRIWPVTIKRFYSGIYEIKHTFQVWEKKQEKHQAHEMQSFENMSKELGWLVENQQRQNVLHEEHCRKLEQLLENTMYKEYAQKLEQEIIQNQKECQQASEEVKQEIRSVRNDVNEEVKRNMDSLNTIKAGIENNNGYAMEILWAEIFESATKNSFWLLDKTFSPGRWAVGYQFLYVMYRVLNEVRPKRILELGLGQSTRMIAQYAKSREDVEHIVVEHDEKWVEFFVNDFSMPVCSKIEMCELKMIPYKEAEAVRIYGGLKEKLEGKRFDFISIDAPLGEDMKAYARIDVLQMLPECLSENFVILFDDYHRRGENRTVAEMEECLKNYGISYKKGKYSGKKECVILCAESLFFLTTM